METVRLIKLVVKKEMIVPISDPVIFLHEFVNQPPPGIGDPETARHRMANAQLVIKRYDRLRFIVNGENRFLYVNFDDAISADRVLTEVLNEKTKELSDRIEELTRHKANLHFDIAALKMEVDFYKRLLIVRCFMWLLNRWKEVKRWRLRLVRKLGIR